MSEETPDPLDSLEIPANIDPRLLELWFHREREALEKGTTPPERKESERNRKLTWLFASYVGILVMCLVIVLGLLRGLATEEILTQTCQAFLIYTILGFLAGWIVEYCVADSVESLLRELVRKSFAVAETEPPDDANAGNA